MNRPYILVIPSYKHNSAGIRVVHMVGHLLHQMGERVYTITEKISEKYYIPFIDTQAAVQMAKNSAIVIYPEVVGNNLLGGPRVVRYILNHPGAIGGPKNIPHDGPWVYYSAILGPAPHLFIAPIETDLFYYDKSVKKTKKLVCGKKGDTSELKGDFVQITRLWPETRKELADLLREGEVLYIYDSLSTITNEAVMCGTPVVIIPDGLRTREEYIRTEYTMKGIAWTEKELDRAKEDVLEAQDVYKRLIDTNANRVKEFVDFTQKSFT